MSDTKTIEQKETNIDLFNELLGDKDLTFEELEILKNRDLLVRKSDLEFFNNLPLDNKQKADMLKTLVINANK